MIEIGHPFSKPFQDLIDSLTDSVRDGVEQPAQIDILFRKDTPSYEIKGQVYDVSRVTGMRRKAFVVFERNTHYRYAAGRLIWLPPADASDPDWYPDDNSRVTVEYTYRDPPSGLTDFNEGSVTGTLVRAVARELKLLYEQMDQAYRRAFIDIAQGVALDNVVALVGITRNPAVPAKGTVTFRLKKAAKNPVVISPKTRVADAKGRIFIVIEGGIIDPGKTAVTLPVMAQEPGPDGNVGSGSINVMPTPPKGVDGGVNNDAPLTGGEPAESDEQLRERAKHALEVKGKATLNALKYAILAVDGVEGVEVQDFAADESIPLGEVRVRYSGGDPQAIQSAIDDTRAAGIWVRAEAITSVFLSGNVYVIPDTGFAADSLDKLKAAIVAALKGLSIGDPAYVRRFAALAYQIPGLADVAETQLDFTKKPGGDSGRVSDPFVVKAGELVRADDSKLLVLALTGLRATGKYMGAQSRTDLQISLVKADGSTASFRTFKINVTVVVKARLKAAPDQPTQRVCQVEAQLQFSETDTVTLQVQNADIKDAPGHPGFRLGADGHDPKSVEFQVAATAYPVLKPGSAPVDITGIS